MDETAQVNLINECLGFSFFHLYAGRLFFSGRKNNDPNRQDQGMSSMISGGALAVLAVSVAAAIVVAMGNIKF